MINRRSLVKVAAITPLLVASGVYFTKKSYQQLIEEAVRSKLSYLQIDPNGLKQFAVDYAKLYPKDSMTTTGIDAATRLTVVGVHEAHLIDRVDYFRTFVSRIFLKSSDFFINKEDESKVVNYIGIRFSDPYTAPCFNPFAQFS